MDIKHLESGMLAQAKPVTPPTRVNVVSAESAKLKRSVLEALVRYYPNNGEFSRQERLVITQLGIDAEEIKVLAQRRREEEHKLLLLSRTISKACPLTPIESLSFNYYPVSDSSGKTYLLVQPLHQKDHVVRGLHQCGAIKIVRQNIKFDGKSYLQIEAQGLTPTPLAKIDREKASAMLDVGFKAHSTDESWIGFSFCAAEHALTRRTCLVLHGVGTLLRTFSRTGAVTLSEEQEYFDTNSPYSMMALVLLPASI